MASRAGVVTCCMALVFSQVSVSYALQVKPGKWQFQTTTELPTKKFYDRVFELCLGDGAVDAEQLFNHVTDCITVQSASGQDSLLTRLRCKTADGQLVVLNTEFKSDQNQIVGKVHQLRKVGDVGHATELSLSGDHVGACH